MINLQKIIFLVILVGLFVGKVFGEMAGLQVEIRPQQVSVKNSETALVDTKVKNLSESVVSINVWFCSYNQNWVSDSVYAAIEGITCHGNAITKVILEP